MAKKQSALEERVEPMDHVQILPNGSIEVREATRIYRHGEPDHAIPPRYHRYVLHPGDPLDGRDPRLAAVAGAVWTDDVVKAWRAAQRKADAG